VCHHPNTRGLLLRKTTKQITNAGGLFDSAIRLYKKVDPNLKIRNRDLELVFSTGATLKFGYIDNDSDKYNYQGTEITWLGWDELQQIKYSNFLYLLSRVRGTNVDYPKQVVATGNPDYDSFLREWVEHALDDRGIPIRRDSYPNRYFVQTSNGGTEWADKREDLEKIYGEGGESGILSFKFVPGTIYDNPVLMESDKAYVSKLKALPSVEKDRLLYGSWYARESASGYWKEHWVTEVLYPPASVLKRVRGWDLAFTKPNESSSKNPDFTAGVLMSKDTKSLYTVEDVVRIRDRPHVVEETILNTAKTDGVGVIIGLPLDPSGGGAYVKGLQKRLIEAGFTCRLVRPIKSKVLRFAPFAAVAEGGFVSVVKGDWTSDYHRELEAFDGTNKFKDDQADASSDCFYLLNKAQTLPSFSLPDLSQTPSFGFQSSSIPTDLTTPLYQGEFT
jgi:predicted phage terminase large subunit-like protein